MFLPQFLLRRSRDLGLSKTELCKRANISRETLYRLLRGDLRSITFETLIGLAAALDAAPLHVARLVYQEFRSCPATELPTQHVGDHASFVRDVTFPDDGVVPAGQKGQSSMCVGPMLTGYQSMWAGVMLWA